MRQKKTLKIRVLKLKIIDKLALLAFIFSFSTVTAQEALLTSGGNALGSGGSVSYSVGQLVYTNNTGISGSVIQSIQQPFEISVVTEIEQAIGINLVVSAYPNPATDYIILKIDASASHVNQSLSYKLYDFNGKLLESKKIANSQTNIAMSNLVPASYFLKIIKDDKELKSFKIIKK